MSNFWLNDPTILFQEIPDKFTFIDNDILFTPVYLVVDETNKIYQIGVYEFHSKQLENLKDEDGDLDISIIDGPLLYTFIDKPYINKYSIFITFSHKLLLLPFNDITI